MSRHRCEDEAAIASEGLWSCPTCNRRWSVRNMGLSAYHEGCYFYYRAGRDADGWPVVLGFWRPFRLRFVGYPFGSS